MILQIYKKKMPMHSYDQNITKYYKNIIQNIRKYSNKHI